VGEPDSAGGGRVASEQRDQFERDRGQGFATGRSTVYVYNDRDGCVSGHLLRQGVRHDRHVFVDLPTPVQYKLAIRYSNV